MTASEFQQIILTTELTAAGGGQLIPVVVVFEFVNALLIQKNVEYILVIYFPCLKRRVEKTCSLKTFFLANTTNDTNLLKPIEWQLRQKER